MSSRPTNIAGFTRSSFTQRWPMSRTFCVPSLPPTRTSCWCTRPAMFTSSRLEACRPAKNWRWKFPTRRPAKIATCQDAARSVHLDIRPGNWCCPAGHSPVHQDGGAPVACASTLLPSGVPRSGVPRTPRAMPRPRHRSFPRARSRRCRAASLGRSSTRRASYSTRAVSTAAPIISLFLVEQLAIRSHHHLWSEGRPSISLSSIRWSPFRRFACSRIITTWL